MDTDHTQALNHAVHAQDQEYQPVFLEEKVSVVVVMERELKIIVEHAQAAMVQEFNLAKNGTVMIAEIQIAHAKMTAGNF